MHVHLIAGSNHLEPPISHQALPPDSKGGRAKDSSPGGGARFKMGDQVPRGVRHAASTTATSQLAHATTGETLVPRWGHEGRFFMVGGEY